MKINAIGLSSTRRRLLGLRSAELPNQKHKVLPRNHGTRRYQLTVSGCLLAAAIALTSSGCTYLPPFPALPQTSADDIRTLNLIPEWDLGDIALSDDGGLGFTAIERMTVRIRNVRCDGLGTGTGFAIDPFTIITNRHVIEGTESLIVSTFDGRDIDVHLDDVTMSDEADIAVIRVNDPLTAYVSARRGELFQDEPVTVIGFPEGGAMTVTEGHVLGLIYDVVAQGMGEVILTDAQVLPGSSGSPLLDADFNLVGVIYARTDDFHGLAVRIEMLDNLLAGTAPTSPLQSCRI